MGNLEGLLRVEKMKIYFAGNTLEKQEINLLKRAKKRLLSYYYLEKNFLFCRGAFEMIKEINENQDK